MRCGSECGMYSTESSAGLVGGIYYYADIPCYEREYTAKRYVWYGESYYYASAVGGDPGEAAVGAKCEC